MKSQHKNLFSLSKINETIKSIIAVFFLTDLDVMVVALLSIGLMIYFFSTYVSIALMSITIVYAIVRLTNDFEALFIYVFILIYMFIIFVGSVYISQYSERTLIYNKVIVCNNAKFIKKGFYMVFDDNNSSNKNTEVVRLSELNWYKMQQRDCQPIKTEKLETSYGDVKHKSILYTCQYK